MATISNSVKDGNLPDINVLVESNPIVIVVEDDPEVLEMLKLQLKLCAPTLISFCDPSLALQFIRDNFTKHDELNNLSIIIISDLNMRPINGFDLLQYARTILPNIPFYLMSCNATKQDIQKAINLKVTAFIDKTDIVIKIRKVIEDLKTHTLKKVLPVVGVTV